MFKKYRRTNIAEMRDLRPSETVEYLQGLGVSISEPDMALADIIFKQGKIARNPDNHKDQWYVARDYFDTNFEEVK